MQSREPGRPEGRTEEDIDKYVQELKEQKIDDVQNLDLDKLIDE